MDAHDIFHKLTRGVHFSKNKKKHENKKPKLLMPSSHEDDLNQQDDLENTSEIKDEVNDENDFQVMFDDKVTKSPKPVKKSKENHKLLEIEELNHFRKVNRISVTGKNIPVPIRNFEQLSSDDYKVSSKILQNLTSCGYTTPTPIQMQAIPIMLQGRGLMACAPTGSGKTVAFLTPIMRDLKGPQKKGFRAIILCPTRELAKQTYRESLRLNERIGLKIHVISKIKQIKEKYGSTSNKKYDILVSTPNRVRYLLQQTPPLLDLSGIEWFIIDEADKLMEDGKNSFKEQLEEILLACTNSKKKLALFSATYTAPVAKWALKNLKNLIRITIGERNSATDLVNQELLFVGNESGKLLAIRDLVRNGLKPPVLIFVQSKERGKQLFTELIYDGINVDVIHADRSQQQRDNVVRAFREGKIWVLICTELMGRGIDFKGVNLVINYDFPPTSISYIHRIGRTGRAGRPGNAITYFTQDDTPNLRSIAHIIKNSGGKVPEFMFSLKKPKKSEKKKSANQAPDREDITTIPKFVLEKRQQLREKRLAMSEENSSDQTNFSRKKHNKFKENNKRPSNEINNKEKIKKKKL